VVAPNPMAYAMGYRSVAALRLKRYARRINFAASQPTGIRIAR
jgi:hypothetical protein